jgi:hypothetical protein
MHSEKPVYLSRSKQASRYGVVPKTIKRWENDPKLEYPPGIDINGRPYRPLDALENWEARRGIVGTRKRQAADDASASAETVRA